MRLKKREEIKPVIVVDLIGEFRCKTLQFEDANVLEAYENLKSVIPQVKRTETKSGVKLLVQIQERLGKKRVGVKSYVTYIGYTPKEAKELVIKNFS